MKASRFFIVLVIAIAVIFITSLIIFQDSPKVSTGISKNKIVKDECTPRETKIGQSGSTSFGGCFRPTGVYAMKLSPAIDCLSYYASDCNGADIQFTNKCPSIITLDNRSINPQESAYIVNNQVVESKQSFTLKGVYNNQPFIFTYKLSPYQCKEITQ